MNYTVIKANEYIKQNLEKVNSKHRHRFHLMPEVGWMNDPNGFIYYQGYYHLFYQFYPYEAKWGPMHWGHARSKNLIDWEHLPVALAPDLAHEDGCFSGGATEFNGKLYLMYTSHYHQAFQRQEQSLAISNDGIHFEKGPVPVITIEDLPEDASKIDFRDPNPVTIGGKHFILIGSSTMDKHGQILVYQTDDFKTFHYKNAILHPLLGEIAECPDLFELDGKHVLLFSATNLKANDNRFKNVNSSLYAIGQFDIETGEFHFEHVDEIDAGHHYYAPQTLLQENTRVSVAWMEMWGKPYYTALSNHAWAGAMTLPRTLSIVNNRLIQTPVCLDQYAKEIRDLTHIGNAQTSKYFVLTGRLNTHSKTNLRFGHYHNHFNLSFDEGCITLDTSGTTLFPLEARSLSHQQKEVQFTLVMDNSSLELFVHGLDKTITTRVYFDEALLDIEIDSQTLHNLTLKELSK